MYHYDEKEKKIDFSHNPFSMPQGDIKNFDKTDPLKILAYQYDLVCMVMNYRQGQYEITFQNTYLKFLARWDIQRN